MSSLYQLLLFAIFNPLHSLKLLTVGDDDSMLTAGDDDASMDLASMDLAVSNLPEEWETDITFSYKPLAGKCKEVGAFKLLNKGNGDAGYQNSKNGQICAEVCNKAKGPTAADVTKFCDVVGVKKGQYKFTEVVAAWKKVAKQRCARIMAKVYSMSSLETKCKSNPVTAFDMKASDCSVRGFKSTDGGKPVTAVAAAGYFCYGPAGITWAKNDPKVKNMDGEEFEIMATGTFSLLSLKEIASQTTTLEVLSTIDRAGSRCGATYIQNITLQGEWIQTVAGVPQIEIRAQPSVPKSEALQVKFENEWKPANSQWKREEVQLASATKFSLKVHQVSILISADSHRIHESGMKTRRFANFLNVNFNGISSLSGISIGGLLGRDSHEEAATAPSDCDLHSLLSDTTPEALMLSQINYEQK
jgi:hypothetical protein